MDPHAHTHSAENSSALKDKAAGHGMVVVGKETIFFSHLPMFMSPHDYQVILEGTFSKPGADPQRTYKDDRKNQPEGTVFTFNPAAFVLPDLFPPAAKRKQFRGDLFRGHFESPPEFPAEPSRIASGVNVDVTNVVYFQKLIPPAKRPDNLEYLLFGKGEELFLAHLITGPPDFDQIVSAKITGHEFPADELRRGVRVQVIGTTHSSAQRLKPGKAVSASAQGAGQKVTFKVEPGTELYFMERELKEE
jgi:hypothetical protein